MYDKSMIREFLMHLAGELRMQQMGLAGKPATDKLRQGLPQFRTKYGVTLLPAVLPNSPDGGGEENREAFARLRADQFEHALGILELLDELELSPNAQQGVQ
jgi:hypothetical protein